MVNRTTTIIAAVMLGIFIVFTITQAADKKYYDFPTTGTVGANDRVLIYQNNTSRNITGTVLFSTVTGLAASRELFSRYTGHQKLNAAASDTEFHGIKSGSSYIAFGRRAAESGAATGNNTAIGANAMRYWTPGAWAANNTAIGANAMEGFVGGTSNIFIGEYAGWNTNKNMVGNYNTVIGTNGGQHIGANGSYNTMIGANASGAMVSNTTVIGYGSAATSGHNTAIVIGYNAASKGANTTVIGNASSTKAYLFGDMSTGTIKAKSIPLLASHVSATGNVHSVTPPQVFGNQTGVRYPVFTGGDSWLWKRPLELCGTDPETAVFDGAPGAPGATGPAGSLSVGTTTTLEPGESAYVVFTGPSSARVAHFGIPKGAQGDAGTLTQADIFGHAAEQSNLPLILQGNADADVKAQLLYSTGETSLWITSGGLVYAQDKSGHVTWGWNNDTREMVFSNYSYGSSRKSMTIDRFGQVKRYAPNGTTLIFASTTTGRIKQWNKTTGKLQEHIAPDGTRTLYRPDGIKVRFENRTSGVTVL